MPGTPLSDECSWRRHTADGRRGSDRPAREETEMTVTDTTAHTLATYRTAELDRRNERARRARELREASRPVAPSRGGFATQVLRALQLARPTTAR